MAPAEPRHDASRRLRRAREAIDRSFADALDVEALANSVHRSRVGITSLGSFSRTFHEIADEELSAKGVESMQETVERFYGIG
ncbi:MAG: hypothetical protein QOG15_2035 [Solirubrobacteraceae bacterium]|jgi:hypothetical protein|nr:hypothetical protein [Solirubrobacteraceae bacterium]